MFVLFETAAGFALFKVTKDKKLEKIDKLHKEFVDAESANGVVKLKAFAKFKDTKDAMKSIEKLMKGKVSKSLNKFLTKNIVQKEIEDTLLVADNKLGKNITEKLGITCKAGKVAEELLRCIRFQMESLVDGIESSQMKQMQLGLAHSVSRYKLAFTSDKVDTMIIQAVSLLEDLDKELNNYAMRLKEWYSWHFPELAKIVTDNVVYSQSVQLIGMRTNTKNLSDEELEAVMPEDIAEEVRQAAEISMGTEITDDDETHIKTLAGQVISISQYRANLAEYLKNRMAAIAPNLTQLVGELVGAKLISHSGSLMNLAKQPASTIQVLGAEKALFRALKSKKNTPKYGLIYNASIVGSAKSNQMKGKISRTLANKCALCVRFDALQEQEDGTMGAKHKTYLENRLKLLESGGQVVKGKAAGGQRKWEPNAEAGGYNADADFASKRPRHE